MIAHLIEEVSLEIDGWENLSDLIGMSSSYVADMFLQIDWEKYQCELLQPNGECAKMKLGKGDKCRVRILKTGEVVDASYDKPGFYNKTHWVYVRIYKEFFITHSAERKTIGPYSCRFVGPAGVIE